MISRRCFLGVFIALAAVHSMSEVHAASPDNLVATVGEMCGGCVKKINSGLKPVAGIASVKCDIATKTVTVVPSEQEGISPRALWEAMEKIGKKPVKLVTPAGTFTSKPQA